jgi:hypothetical protein
MKRAKEKITAMLNAITFAEAGEHETARKYVEQAQSPHAQENHRAHAVRESETRSIFQKLQDHVTASVFAQAGDFQTAAETLHPSERHRTVLLVIEGKAPDEAAFQYALGACKRTGAQMDILQLIDESADRLEAARLTRMGAELSERLSSLLLQLKTERIPFRVTVRSGDVRERLYRYATRHTDIVMAVYDPSKPTEQSAGNRGRQRMVERISRRLSIPLVIVSEREPLGQLQ